MDDRELVLHLAAEIKALHRRMDALAFSFTDMVKKGEQLIKGDNDNLEIALVKYLMSINVKYSVGLDGMDNAIVFDDGTDAPGPVKATVQIVKNPKELYSVTILKGNSPCGGTQTVKTVKDIEQLLKSCGFKFPLPKGAAPVKAQMMTPVPLEDIRRYSQRIACRPSAV